MNRKISIEEKEETESLWGNLDLTNLIRANEDGCSNCGSCCDDILPLSNEDIIRIDKHLKNNVIGETKSQYEIIKDGKIVFSHSCPFLNHHKGSCNIYSARPEICRQYQCNRPLFIFDNDKALLRSMRLVFFNDDSNQLFLQEDNRLKIYGKNCALPIYGRNKLETQTETIKRKIKELTEQLNSLDRSSK